MLSPETCSAPSRTRPGGSCSPVASGNCPMVSAVDAALSAGVATTGASLSEHACKRDSPTTRSAKPRRIAGPYRLPRATVYAVGCVSLLAARTQRCRRVWEVASSRCRCGRSDSTRGLQQHRPGFIAFFQTAGFPRSCPPAEARSGGQGRSAPSLRGHP